MSQDGMGSEHPLPSCLLQARVERMEQFQKEKEELDKGCRECKRKLAECQRKMKELEVAPESGKGELEKLRAEAQQLRKEEKSWEKKLEELRKKEKNLPWNVDTLSKDGFSKSVFNVKPEEKEETEEQKEKKHKTFVERHEKEIKHFGMLRRWDDSQKYLADNPHLVCEETANYLVIWCIDLEVEEVRLGNGLFQPGMVAMAWEWPFPAGNGGNGLGMAFSSWEWGRWLGNGLFQLGMGAMAFQAIPFPCIAAVLWNHDPNGIPLGAGSPHPLSMHCHPLES
uniref:Hsp90 co-chaperone Cdc37 n=1 Tax=Amazona collaria TaxID=241587 RepID=A0A8B9F2U2_9PSIT